MKRLILITVSLILVIALPSISASDNRALKRQLEEMQSEKRVALVIGTSNYKSSPLKNPVNYARAKAKRPKTPKKKTSSGAHGMVFVKGGCFQMGATVGAGYFDEKPVHKVCLDNFYMDKTEVTQRAYRKKTGKSPSKFKNCANCPVEKVNWHEAKAYCKKAGKRLPTEAEWEYAARSGGKKVRYSGTGSTDAYAWHKKNSGRKTHPVAQKEPNGLGLYDMSGNVWEWVADWYDKSYYKRSPRNNPKGPSSGIAIAAVRGARVLRGGSLLTLGHNMRVSDRYWRNPASRDDNRGFRCASTP